MLKERKILLKRQWCCQETVDNKYAIGVDRDGEKEVNVKRQGRTYEKLCQGRTHKIWCS